MPRFLFRFAYRTPEQMEANAANGWDDEESSACFIDAATRDEALAFGCEVAEQMVNRLFASPGDAVVSWKASGFAFWIEDDAAERLALELLETVPEVVAGKMPDFSRWSTPHQG